jgi:hypothetical protein
MTEIWKPVKGYEGLYKVSNMGRIKSVERYMKNHSKLQLVPEKIKSPQDNGHGYLWVQLCKNSKCSYRYVHRLVAEAFIPNPDNKPQVNHLDYNKQNNCVDNLEWVTAKENNEYSMPNRKDKTGPKGAGVIKCDLAGNELERYSGMREAERANNLANGVISKYFKKNYSQCGGYLWKKVK